MSFREELIEVMAKTVFLDHGWTEKSWETAPRSRGVYEREARLALDAALPFLMENALRWNAEAGFLDDDVMTVEMYLAALQD